MVIEGPVKTPLRCTIGDDVSHVEFKSVMFKAATLSCMRAVHTLVAVLLFMTLILITGCHKQPRAARPSSPNAPNRNASSVKPGDTETGIASWYGVPYHGRQAASGEIYDMEQLTAAHKTLPFQTWVEVTNLDNGSVVTVRINDRGPFIEGRIIDLSKRGAREIGLLQTGLAKVQLRVVEVVNPEEANRQVGPRLKPRTPVVVTAKELTPTQVAPVEPPAPRSYAVQAGAFEDRDRAEALARSMSVRFGDARVLSTTPPGLWRVIVGRSLSLGEAGQIFLRIRSEAVAANVVPEPEAPSHD
jgi:rare lipoprotein A